MLGAVRDTPLVPDPAVRQGIPRQPKALAYQIVPAHQVLRALYNIALVPYDTQKIPITITSRDTIQLDLQLAVAALFVCGNGIARLPKCIVARYEMCL